jgi:hypothetical protein
VVQMTRLWGLCELQLRLSFFCVFFCFVSDCPQVSFISLAQDMTWWDFGVHILPQSLPRPRRSGGTAHMSLEGGHHSDGGLSPTE